MASIFVSIFASKVSARRLPLSTATALIGVAGVAYFATRRPFYCDAPSLSNARMPTKEMTKTLSFPYNMLSSRHLTSSNMEQENHDTKKITFTILGGDGEVSGVLAEVRFGHGILSMKLTVPTGAILTQHTPTGRFFPVLRPYTPISDECICARTSKFQI
jgi:cytochrome-b5 reductase